jgi:LysM repeat protein
MLTYTVQAGNTLSGIARKFGVPLSALIAANQITDPNQLKVGDKLLIPSVDTDLSTLPPPPVPPAPIAPSGNISIDRKKFALAPGQYFAETFPKDLIVLHFTAGSSARSAYDSWRNTPLQVATAYLVDTDGKIYECFPPNYWAYHLGITGAASANWKHDKRSIGIEIANVGPLLPDKNNPQQLNWWPNDFQTKHCTLAETGKYVAAPYRGYNHYASFPAPQSDAVIALVAHLCDAFSISRVLPPADRQTAYDIDYFKSFRGIATHQNFRKDKTDVGPAFPLAQVAPAATA